MPECRRVRVTQTQSDVFVSVVLCCSHENVSMLRLFLRQSRRAPLHLRTRHAPTVADVTTTPERGPYCDVRCASLPTRKHVRHVLMFCFAAGLQLPGATGAYYGELPSAGTHVSSAALRRRSGSREKSLTPDRDLPKVSNLYDDM